MGMIQHLPMLVAASLLTASVVLVGCEDPAKNKPAATVTTAKATASATPSVSASDGALTLVEDSKVQWVGSKVTGEHPGGFEKVSASAKLDEGKPEGGAVEVTIDVTSLYSDSDKLTGHLLSEDFFASKEHPEAKFVSTAIRAGGEGDATHTVEGNLTLRGETKGISFPATITVQGDQVVVKSEFSINRKDFGMVYTGKADDLINDLVVIKLDLTFGKG